MFTLLADTSVIYAYKTSDLFGKGIILALIAFSTLAWAIMVEKWLAVRRLQKEMSDSWQDLRFAPEAEDILAGRSRMRGPCAALLEAAVDGAARARRQTVAAIDGVLRSRKPLALTPAELETIRLALDAEQLRQQGIMESRMALLSTIVSLSPFLGLLGTVWGVMIAFCGMAMQGKADINILAPGVAGALLTTVAGLLVAIPALIGFNMMSENVNRLCDETSQYADELLCRLRTQVDPNSGNG